MTKRKREGAPHVVAVHGGFWCIECGKRQAGPASTQAFLAAGQAFLEQHRDCKPAEAKP